MIKAGLSRRLLTYEEYKTEMIKYPKGGKCFIFDCNKNAMYEGGDARFYCAMCEEHANLRSKYRVYLGCLISDVQKLLSVEEMYDKAKEKQYRIQKKLEEALNGPEPCKIKQNLS